MKNAKLIHRQLRLLNSSDQDLEVWLEWDVPVKYMIAPKRHFLVHGLVREAHMDRAKASDWEVSVDMGSNCIVIYIMDELLLIEDFYLTDSVTSQRIKPYEC